MAEQFLYGAGVPVDVYAVDNLMPLLFGGGRTNDPDVVAGSR